MDLRLVGGDWLEEQRGQLRSANTIRTYGRYLALFWDWASREGLGSVPAAFTRVTVYRYAAACAARGVGQNSIHQYESCFEQFGKYLMRQYPRTWTVHPLAGLVKPKVRLVQPAPVPPGVFEEMLLAARYGDHAARDTAFLWFLMETNVRIDELQHLTLGSIQHRWGNKRQGRVTVRGKGNKVRHVFYTGDAWVAMDAWLRVRAHSVHEALFLNERGAPLTDNAARRLLQRLSERAQVPKGVRTNPHNWRRTGARRRLRNGMDLESLRQWLGHENIATTAKHYVFSTDEDLEGMAESTSPSRNQNGTQPPARRREAPAQLRIARMGGPNGRVPIRRAVRRD